MRVGRIRYGPFFASRVVLSYTTIYTASIGRWRRRVITKACAMLVPSRVPFWPLGILFPRRFRGQGNPSWILIEGMVKHRQRRKWNSLHMSFTFNRSRMRRKSGMKLIKLKKKGDSKLPGACTELRTFFDLEEKVKAPFFELLYSIPFNYIGFLDSCPWIPFLSFSPFHSTILSISLFYQTHNK